MRMAPSRASCFLGGVGVWPSTRRPGGISHDTWSLVPKKSSMPTSTSYCKRDQFHLDGFGLHVHAGDTDR